LHDFWRDFCHELVNSAKGSQNEKLASSVPVMHHQMIKINEKLQNTCLTPVGDIQGTRRGPTCGLTTKSNGVKEVVMVGGISDSGITLYVRACFL
jgi:hypothetical protein